MSTEPTTTSQFRSEPLSAAEALSTEYLDRLRRAAAGLPAGRRAELIDDITAHLSELIGPDADEARARQVLDELGTPEEIAAAAAAEGGTAHPGGGELAYDVATGLVLLLGGFVVPVLGWVAGVVMLWNGPRWSTREKWAGTLIWPAAIVVGVVLLLVAHAGLGPAVLLIGGLVVLAGLIAGFAVLMRAAAQRRA
ncbi:HAAS signaling domain-containing protein [Amycolatopsis sp. PS_44_ISF1]|uniref:HAAS signaling domain-containing protein n=1 Tax=Amycolatopsis sp. PS_44_ISF1 TaxID=2974917 RepID=UPI0028DF5628|nr:hypothetical protein [Amycolatopsis sp. PS_44_ISF1]MDT8912557.1 hypothetical protein [Amycolatopsis sp. PS_44_ISF1]